MAINEEVWIPLVPQLEPRAHLRRIGLQIIAIEIEICSRHTPAHLGRPVLIDAIVSAEPLVPVRVEDRDEQKDDVIEQVRASLRDCDVT